jgi:hypothetical protein
MRLAELENLFMNGFADDETGDVDSPTGHVYRVGRWLVHTDSSGFHTVFPYTAEADATEAFARIDTEFSEWMNDADG